MRAHENAGFESLGDIMPISPYWVAQKWFSQYFQEGDMPAARPVSGSSLTRERATKRSR